MQHLLVAPSRLSHADANIPAASEIHSLPDRILDTEWKAVNEFYFKSLASVQLLQQICLKHHHDFTSEQVGDLGLKVVSLWMIKSNISFHHVF